MKTHQSTPVAKARTSTKVSPKAKASPSLKPSLRVKNFLSPSVKPRANGALNPRVSPARRPTPAQARPPGTAAPQDHASQHAGHSADAVRARAYLNYEKRGSEDGDPTNDWLRAEAELIAERHLGRA